jgi:DnaK suppressor protein
MNDKKITSRSDIKNRIEKEILILENHIKNERDEIKKPEVGGDDVDRAALMQNQQIASTIRFHDNERLMALKKALKRLGSDDFGFCESCGDDIEPIRLNARPEAEMCITCADLDFQKSKQMVG